MRQLRSAAAGALALFAAGCTYHTEPLSGQPGTLTVAVPGSLPTVVSPRPSPEPPAASSTQAALEPGSLPAEGRYTGSATLIHNPGHRCDRTVPINNWVVTGDRVRFGAFRGSIRPDGSLQMRGGDGYITGRFTESRFTGRFWRPGRTCTYALNLEAAG